MMSTSIDLIVELSKSNPQPVPFDPMAVKIENRTPAHLFVTLVAQLNESVYIALTSRDGYNEHIARAVLEFLRMQPGTVNLEVPVQLLKGFHCDSVNFDAILLLGPVAHRLFHSISSRLHDRTVEVIPVHRGEFSGREDPGLIDLIRKDVVPTLDWQRSPSPQVYLRFDDKAKGVRSTGKKPGLTTKEYFLHKLLEMVPKEGSFIEATNIIGEKCTFLPSSQGIIVKCSELAQELTLDRKKIVGWVDTFLTEGLTGL